MSKYEKLWNYIAECGEEKIMLGFDEIEKIGKIPVDHSFLRYKKELLQYGWEVEKIFMKERKIMFKRTHG